MVGYALAWFGSAPFHSYSIIRLSEGHGLLHGCLLLLFGVDVQMTFRVDDASSGDGLVLSIFCGSMDRGLIDFAHWH